MTIRRIRTAVKTLTGTSAAVRISMVAGLVSWFQPMYSSSASDAELYRRWMKIPSAELMQMGRDYGFRQGMPDSALACFTIVANRYADNLPKAEKQRCVDACNMQFYVYNSVYFDYAKGYESLTRALEIAKATGQPNAMLWMNMGSMYHVLADQSNDNEAYLTAFGYYRKGFWKAIRERDTETLELLFPNMLTVAQATHRMDSLAGEWKAYQQSDSLTLCHLHGFNLLLYEGLLAMSHGQAREALTLFGQQEEALRGSKGTTRFLSLSLFNMADAYARLGRYGEGRECLQRARRLLQDAGIRDGEIDVWRHQAELFASAGDTLRGRDAQYHYLMLKDSLANYRMVSNMSSMQFMGEIRDLNDQMARLNTRHQIEAAGLFIAAIVIIIIATLLTLIYRKNRTLRQRNRSLYEQSRRLMAKEAEKSAPKAETTAPKTERGTPKYGNNRLEESELDELWAKIQQVMATSDQVYGADFNLEQMAQLVGVKSNYVSQTVNERYQASFTIFLNDSRVKEACRRMHLSEYANHSIEGIAQSVGIKSRTTFGTAFKRMTGLTPSEYMRFVMEKKCP